MNRKIFDFLSSFGMMILGVILLFLSALYYPNLSKKIDFLPKVEDRIPLVLKSDFQNSFPVSHPNVPAKKDQSDFEGVLTAAAAFLVDDKTDTVLFEKNADSVRPLASITKLMSALVILDIAPDWNKRVEISSDIYDSGSHFAYLKENFSMEELWNIGLISSSNTAIRALVKGSGLTTEQFVEKMNSKAIELRLFSMHFDEATGLSFKNVGSARDVARLLKISLSNEKIFNTLKTPEYVLTLPKGKTRLVKTTDWLLTGWVPNKFGEFSIAGKTGYIDDSKYNFAVRIENGGQRAIRAVVLGAHTVEARFSEARDLASWAFVHYAWPGDNGYEDLQK